MKQPFEVVRTRYNFLTYQKSPHLDGPYRLVSTRRHKLVLTPTHTHNIPCGKLYEQPLCCESPFPPQTSIIFIGHLWDAFLKQWSITSDTTTKIARWGAVTDLKVSTDIYQCFSLHPHAFFLNLPNPNIKYYKSILKQQVIFLFLRFH